MLMSIDYRDCVLLVKSVPCDVRHITRLGAKHILFCNNCPALGLLPCSVLLSQSLHTPESECKSESCELRHTLFSPINTEGNHARERAHTRTRVIPHPNQYNKYVDMHITP